MEYTYEEILKNYDYEDPEQIFEAIEKSEDPVSFEMLYMIVLWKTNRLIHSDDLIQIKEKIEALRQNPPTEYNRNDVEELLTLLLKTRGIRLPMASTILHFYFPDVFPIIDQRAYRAAYSWDFSQKYSDEGYKRAAKTEYPNQMTLTGDAAIKYAIDRYFGYIEQCKKIISKLKPELNLGMKDIDRLLYTMDALSKIPVKY